MNRTKIMACICFENCFININREYSVYGEHWHKNWKTSRSKQRSNFLKNQVSVTLLISELSLWWSCLWFFYSFVSLGFWNFLVCLFIRINKWLSIYGTFFIKIILNTNDRTDSSQIVIAHLDKKEKKRIKIMDRNL